MKIFKNIFSATFLIAFALFIQSCTDDDNETYYTEIGTVTNASIASSEANTIQGDESGLCYITNNNVLKAFKADSIGQRVIYTYTVEENRQKEAGSATAGQRNIRIVDLYKVLTKNMDTLDPSTQTDDFGKDPIYISWINVSQAHLNIEFIIGRDNPSIAHRISLVALQGAEPDENGVLNVELRHNKFNDNYYINVAGYVSYTLESIPGYKEGKLKKLIINCHNTDSETKKYEININNLYTSKRDYKSSSHFLNN